MKVMGWFKRFFNPYKPPIDQKKVEKALGYRFSDSSLLFRSLIHRSYSQATEGTSDLSNERLEFLGDSVLNMVISHALYELNPGYREGDLTKLKSSLVSKGSTAIAGYRAGIDKFMLLSRSEEEAGGRSRTSIIADTYEAVIGAVYLDGGLEEAKKFIQKTILDDVEGIIEKSLENYKSLLLEFTQSRKLGYPTYRTVTEEGPDHDKVFTVEVYVMGKSCGTGKGKSKKIAQQIAARECYTRLQEENNNNHRGITE